MQSTRFFSQLSPCWEQQQLLDGLCCCDCCSACCCCACFCFERDFLLRCSVALILRRIFTVFICANCVNKQKKYKVNSFLLQKFCYSVASTLQTAQLTQHCSDVATSCFCLHCAFKILAAHTFGIFTVLINWFHSVTLNSTNLSLSNINSATTKRTRRINFAKFTCS